MYGTRIVLAAAGATMTLGSAASAAPILGQVDTFEDGSTAGWSAGGPHPAPPANVATGGPAGADDNYLQLTAVGGSVPGGRLSAFNSAQWAGDYLAAGITAIAMDLRNDGPDDVVLRLLLAGPFGPTGPENVAVTADAATLPAGSGWVSVTFSLLPSDLEVLLGTAAGALTQASELRLFHNPDPFFGGPPQSSPPVVAVVGVDNVTAVPEPGSLLLLGVATAWGAARRRRADRADA